MTTTAKKPTRKTPVKKTRPFRDVLKLAGACSSGIEWVGERTAQQAWDECDKPGYLFWWLEHSLGEKETLAVRRKIVRIACEVARSALSFVPAGEDRPRLAIETAERWAGGEKVSVEEIDAARDAAWAAWDAARAAWDAARAAWAAARDAAWAARDAARAARDSAGAAWDAARAARDAARAARAAARAAWADQCKIIRKHFPKAPALRVES